MITLANKTRVAIVKDGLNQAIEKPFGRELSKLADFKDVNFSYVDTDSKKIPDLTDYHVAVVGISRTDYPTQYKPQLYAFLDAWRHRPERPILLLVSDNPTLTQDLVEKWEGWKLLPPELKSAVIVNEKQLASPAQALHKCIDAAHKMSDKLAVPAQNLGTPSPTVSEPKVSGNRLAATLEGKNV